MPYWIHGRDRATGRALEPFASTAPSDMAARVDAIARGIVVDSITRMDEPPGQQASLQMPAPPIARPSSRTPHAARYHDDDDPYQSYEAILGPHATMYYLRRFVDFDRAGRTRATWHWPAFLVAFFWLVHRKMWAYALGYLVAVILVGVVAGILAGLIARLSGAPAGSQAFGTVVAATGLLYAAVVVITPALYANAIYHRHCRREIERARTAGSTDRQRLEWLTRRGGTEPLAVLALAVLIASCVAYVVVASRMG